MPGPVELCGFDLERTCPIRRKVPPLVKEPSTCEVQIPQNKVVKLLSKFAIVCTEKSPGLGSTVLVLFFADLMSRLTSQ